MPTLVQLNGNWTYTKEHLVVKNNLLIKIMQGLRNLFALVGFTCPTKELDQRRLTKSQDKGAGTHHKTK